MKAAKERNEQDQFIQPASRGMGMDNNTIAPSDYNPDGTSNQNQQQFYGSNDKYN